MRLPAGILAGAIMLAMAACAPPATQQAAGPAEAGPVRTVAVGEVSGGDGGSIETAIRFDGAQSSADGVAAEYEYVRSYLPGWRPNGQALIERGGRQYDEMTLVNGSGQTRKVYFDITSWFGKIPGLTMPAAP